MELIIGIYILFFNVIIIFLRESLLCLEESMSGKILTAHHHEYLRHDPRDKVDGSDSDLLRY